MHGDKHISTRNLARELGLKHIEPATADQAAKWTGYLVGGTSPFGMKTALPVYVEESIWALDEIFINGGKRGFIVGMKPEKPADAQSARCSCCSRFIKDWKTDGTSKFIRSFGRVSGC